VPIRQPAEGMLPVVAVSSADFLQLDVNANKANAVIDNKFFIVVSFKNCFNCLFTIQK